MSQNPVPLVACPNCGADGKYRQWREVLPASGYKMKIRSDAHSYMGSDVSAIVCTNCGNLQLFVNPLDFQMPS